MTGDSGTIFPWHAPLNVLSPRQLEGICRSGIDVELSLRDRRRRIKSRVIAFTVALHFRRHQSISPCLEHILEFSPDAFVRRVRVGHCYESVPEPLGEIVRYRFDSLTERRKRPI